MSILRRRSMMQSRAGASPVLPAEYQQVEWIATDGDSFIQTGFRPNQSSRVLLEWEHLDMLSINSTIMGTIDRPGNTKGNWQIREGGSIVCGIVGTWTNIDTIPSGNIDMQYGTVVVNSVPFTFNVGTYDVPVYGLILGGLLSAGNLNQNAKIKMKIKHFAAYYNSNDQSPLVNLYPCYRKADGEIGMFDLVSQTFFTNAGTGTFTKGANV